MIFNLPFCFSFIDPINSACNQAFLIGYLKYKMGIPYKPTIYGDINFKDMSPHLKLKKEYEQMADVRNKKFLEEEAKPAIRSELPEIKKQLEMIKFRLDALEAAKKDVKKAK